MNKQKFHVIYICIAVFFVIGIITLYNTDSNKTQNGEITAPTKEVSVPEEMQDLESISINGLAGSLYTKSGALLLDKKIAYLLSKNEAGKASFLSSFIGDYENALHHRDSLCKTGAETQKAFCDTLNISLKSSIEDTNGSKLDGVTITVDGGKDFTTDRNLYNNFVHRIKFSKKGYLDSYKKIVLGNGSDGIIDSDIKLFKTDYTLTTPAEKEISYKTKNFEYTLDANSFVDQEGNPATGNIDVFFFDVGAGDGDLNVLNLDAFDGQYNYAGSSMSTLGMPLVKAYSGSQELKLNKKIHGKGKIQNLERAPGMDLKNVPKNTWLSKEELDTFKIPPFWFLDQKDGVWKVSQMQILDSLGNYEFNL